MMFRSVPGFKSLEAWKGTVDGAAWIAGVYQNVMAAAHAIDYKTCPLQRRDNLPRIGDGQMRAHAAMVIFRTVGDASAGIGSP
jgi:hypothetical protein